MSPRSGALTTHRLADGIVIGEAESVSEVDPDEFDLLLTAEADPPRPWVSASLATVESAVEVAPAAALTLVQVLRATERVSVESGLAVESMAYSMLQHGEVFERWLAGRPSRSRPAETADPLQIERNGDRLDLVLQRPDVHNALSASLRDALYDAFDLVDADESISEVRIRGVGPSFCSGGDLHEFGHARDAAEAHRLRLARSVGRRVHTHRDKVVAEIHGSCVGAGIEISAFAGRVIAAPHTTALLPELRMGLIPGAGGTVSLPRRIGRHRTAWLALSGEPIGAETAWAWGLVDEIGD